MPRSKGPQEAAMNPGENPSWMYQTLGKTPEQKRTKHMTKPIAPVATKAPGSTDPAEICMGCGKVMSGKYTGESGGAETARTHMYKGERYSGRYCEDCEPKAQQDFRAQYMQYRRERENKQES